MSRRKSEPTEEPYTDEDRRIQAEAAQRMADVRAWVFSYVRQTGPLPGRTEMCVHFKMPPRTIDWYLNKIKEESQQAAVSIGRPVVLSKLYQLATEEGDLKAAALFLQYTDAAEARDIQRQAVTGDAAEVVVLRMAPYTGPVKKIAPAGAADFDQTVEK